MIYIIIYIIYIIRLWFSQPFYLANEIFIAYLSEIYINSKCPTDADSSQIPGYIIDKVKSSF